MTTFDRPADPIAATYIATVWFSDTADDVGTRQIVWLQATSPEDFTRQLRQAWPFKILSFGPVTLARVQR